MTTTNKLVLILGVIGLSVLFAGGAIGFYHWDPLAAWGPAIFIIAATIVVFLATSEGAKELAHKMGFVGIAVIAIMVCALAFGMVGLAGQGISNAINSGKEFLQETKRDPEFVYPPANEMTDQDSVRKNLLSDFAVKFEVVMILMGAIGFGLSMITFGHISAEFAVLLGTSAVIWWVKNTIMFIPPEAKDLASFVFSAGLVYAAVVSGAIMAWRSTFGVIDGLMNFIGLWMVTAFVGGVVDGILYRSHFVFLSWWFADIVRTSVLTMDQVVVHWAAGIAMASAAVPVITGWIRRILRPFTGRG